MSVWRIASEAAATERATKNAEPEPTLVAKMTDVFERLTKWIPADVLLVYAPAVAIVGGEELKPSLTLLILVALLRSR